MVQTVQKNFLCSTKNQVEKDILNCKVQAIVVNPTEKRLKEMVISKLLKNSPIKVEDVTNAYTIFGPNLAGVQGETVIHKPYREGHRLEMDLMPIIRDYYEPHKFVPSTEDVMFVKVICNRRVYPSKYTE